MITKRGVFTPLFEPYDHTGLSRLMFLRGRHRQWRGAFLSLKPIWNLTVVLLEFVIYFFPWVSGRLGGKTTLLHNGLSSRSTYC